MDLLFDLVAGNLSTDMRIWTALAPAIVLAAYFILGIPAYALRSALRGPHRDIEIETRKDRGILGISVRRYFSWLMQPLWWSIRKTGIPANAITTLSMLLSAASGVSLAGGRFALGGWLYIFAGILDFVDGRLARAQGKSSPSGAALDSILDRYSDTVVLVGLAWYYRETWVLLAVLAALGGSLLTSYVRARGEGLGIEIKNGIFQRPERITCLGAGVALSPILAAIRVPTDTQPMHWLAVGGIVLLAISSQITAASRFSFLLRALDGDKTPQLAQWGRGGLPRSVISALVATAADFALVVALVTYVDISAWYATAIGCALGAVVNFFLNRVWAFEAGGAYSPQAARYGFVSLSSMLLNAAGVAVFVLPGIDYRVAWILVRFAVFLGWNFPLHRDYVFARPVPIDSEQAGVA